MEINIFGRIGYDITAQSISEQLENASGDITLKIASYGGDLSEAHAIFNQLRDCSGKVTCDIIGVCASAATIIAMSADRIRMKANGLFMIHEVSMYLSDLQKESELSKIIESMKRMNQTIIEVYKTRTKLTDSELDKMLKAETWMTAEQAKELGFIDEIVPLKTVDEKAIRNQAIQEERQRVSELNNYQAMNESVRAMIKVAVDKGQNLSEIKPYLDVLSKTSNTYEYTAQMQDFFNSGAGDVGNSPSVSDEAKKKAARDEVVAYQRRMRGE